METTDVIVVGGGASGMLAAIFAAKSGVAVTIIEKMERVGRKIRITGKGRCNITNTKPWEEFSHHIYPKNNLFKPAFYNFSNIDTVELFKSIGLNCVVERGKRVFPQSGVASDVVGALAEEIERMGVKVILNTRVTSLTLQDGIITGVETSSKNSTGIYYKRVFHAKAVILATGGLSYPSTGSDGDGYLLAQECGHTVTPCFPSLTALMPMDYSQNLDGLKLKNVQLSLVVDNDTVKTEMGDLDFTNNGIEGPIGLKLSRRAVKALISGSRCFLILDLKPALSEEQLKKRIERELNSPQSKSLNGLLRSLLPMQLIPHFMTYAGSKGDIDRLIKSLKEWRMEIVSYTSYERAVVTAGGVSMNEIFHKSMKSKVVGNLYIAGELLDLDGDTGGYNLQIAFSTGALAGREAAKYAKSI